MNTTNMWYSSLSSLQQWTYFELWVPSHMSRKWWMLGYRWATSALRIPVFVNSRMLDHLSIYPQMTISLVSLRFVWYQQLDWSNPLLHRSCLIQRSTLTRSGPRILDRSVHLYYWTWRAPHHELELIWHLKQFVALMIEGMNITNGYDHQIWGSLKHPI